MLNLSEKINYCLKIDNTRQKGIAIYLAVTIMTIIMMVALGVSLLSVNQLKRLNEIGASVVAFAAAETGIEWALLNVTDPGYSSGVVTLSNGSTYELFSSNCGILLCVRSVGTYKNTRRAIMIQQ